MPFDSDKQQDWYFATDQDYLDDEPSSSRKVKEGGVGSGPQDGAGTTPIDSSDFYEAGMMQPGTAGGHPLYKDVSDVKATGHDKYLDMAMADYLDPTYELTNQDYMDEFNKGRMREAKDESFVATEITRFGENNGDSSDKFYDKIFEALEKEELTCEDCGKKLGTDEPMDFAPSMSIRCPECQEDFSRHASYNDETGEWTYG